MYYYMITLVWSPFTIRAQHGHKSCTSMLKDRHSSNKLKPCTHESKMSAPSTPVLLTNKVATTRQAKHLEGKTYDLVRDLFSALSFAKTLSAAQKRHLCPEMHTITKLAK